MKAGFAEVRERVAKVEVVVQVRVAVEEVCSPSMISYVDRLRCRTSICVRIRVCAPDERRAFVPPMNVVRLCPR